jgi:hypothetical protein
MVGISSVTGSSFIDERYASADIGARGPEPATHLSGSTGRPNRYP